jgi:hypothetical protein
MKPIFFLPFLILSPTHQSTAAQPTTMAGIHRHRSVTTPPAPPRIGSQAFCQFFYFLLFKKKKFFFYKKTCLYEKKDFYYCFIFSSLVFMLVFLHSICLMKVPRERTSFWVVF